MRDLACDIPAGLHGRWRKHRERSAGAIGRGGDITNGVRVLGTEHAEMPVDCDTPLFGIAHGGCIAMSLGRTPAVHTMDAVGSSVPSRMTTARWSAVATSVSVRTSTPRCCKLPAGVVRKARLECREEPSATFEQHDPYIGRGKFGIFVRKNETYQLGQRTGELDAGRSTAHDAKGQQSPAFIRVGSCRRPVRGNRAHGCGAAVLLRGL